LSRKWKYTKQWNPRAELKNNPSAVQFHITCHVSPKPEKLWQYLYGYLEAEAKQSLSLLVVVTESKRIGESSETQEARWQL
jgi:hypothetical protein